MAVIGSVIGAALPVGKLILNAYERRELRKAEERQAARDVELAKIEASGKLQAAVIAAESANFAREVESVASARLHDTAIGEEEVPVDAPGFVRNLAALSKFIRSMVRPFVTFFVWGVMGYLAMTGSPIPAIIAELAGLVTTFWFGSRMVEKHG